MMKRFLTLAVVAMATTVALAQTQTAKPAAPRSKTLTMVQGAWVMTNANGQDMTAAGAPEVLVTITDNKYTQAQQGTVIESGTFKLDETKKPMTLDLMIAEGDQAGKTQLGLIEVTDTTMRVKLNDPGVAVRPADFAPAEGSYVFEFTKKK